MSIQLWWLVVAGAALAGAVLGALALHLALKRRHDAALKRAVDTARRESAATMERLRAAYTTVRLDQEHQRAALPRKLAAAALEHRATIANLQEELRFTHVELDRLRARAYGNVAPQREAVEHDHGFAPTQTFDDPG